MDINLSVATIQVIPKKEVFVSTTKKIYLFRIRNDICSLSECIVCEVKVNNKKYFLTCLYRSPSQASDEFVIFKHNLEDTISNIELENPFMSLLTGDFNDRCSNWWTEDVDSRWGVEIESLTSYLGLHQLIDSPTHILPNSSSCIDLIFCSQPNLVTSSGVRASLFPSCHHQIVYAHLDFKVVFPPPYQRKVWKYKSADVTSIQRSLSIIDWEKLFQNISIDAQVNLLNEILLNIFENFIPSKILTCNNKVQKSKKLFTVSPDLSTIILDGVDLNVIR